MLERPSNWQLILMAVVLVAAPALLAAPALASEPFLGQIQMVGFNFPPRGWALCDGQLLAISQYSALFALLGTTYGGDGRTTFALPDLRGRVPLHVGTGSGLTSVTWGQRGGAETVTLAVANLPAHNHDATLMGTSARGTKTGPGGYALATDARETQYADAAPNVAMRTGSVTTENTGSGTAVEIRNPYVGIYHCIALTGVFPSRN